MPVNKSTVKIKLDLWTHCLRAGFIVGGMNCLYTEAPQSEEKIRFNFRDDEVLKFEVKRKDPEIKISNYSKYKWFILEEGKYKDIKIGENGELIFKKNKTDDGKKSSKKKGK